MKKLLLLSVITVFTLFLAGNVWAAIYSPSLSELDTFYEVSSGTLTGPDAGPPITVGSDGAFEVTISDETGGSSTWGDVQIGRDATIEGAGSPYYSGSWADLSIYDTYELNITNTSATDWFSANIYLNTGWTDSPYNETDYYYQNGWTWVAPGSTVHLVLDFDTAMTFGGHDLDNLGHVSSLGFNIGTNVGTGDYYGDDLDGKANPVPIPTSVLLLGSGLLGMIGVGFRRRKSTAE